MDFDSYKYYRHLKFCFFVIGLTFLKSTQLRVVHTTIVCLILLLGSIFLMIEDWLKDIKRDSNHIQDKEELKILKTHVAMENRYANIYLIIICTGYFVLTVTLFLPHRILEALKRRY
ncbi:uncharacterized protein LOC122531337 [Frieseomelitta varia]|uniref:uncharacterized protein LOC122531337 n=1 Tax=Frieseomelitta varia TaxID=561572 RepID=UPI001CB6A9AE|nr:uncharacterized protein LOC122531337 [Frieseomelitta varia]